jgi:hypothetical protein
MLGLELFMTESALPRTATELSGILANWIGLGGGGGRGPISSCRLRINYGVIPTLSRSKIKSCNCLKLPKW